MRIAFVTHGYPRGEGDVAGVFVQRLAHALSTRGHELLVLAPADEGRAGEEEHHGVRIRRLRYAPARWETLAYRGTMAEAVRRPAGVVAAVGLIWALARGIRRAVAREGIEVVHAHWWVPGGIAAMRVRAVPYVVTLHGTDVALLDRAPLARAVARRVLARAAAVTAVSRFLARRAAQVTGIDGDRIIVQPMPVAVPGGQAALGGGGIVTVGRLSRQKRTHLVLLAVAKLAAQGQRFQLTVIGDGPERRRLEALSQSLGIADHTRFLGMVPPHRVPELLREADVVAMPAHGEGFGLAAAEALMLGVPVVAMQDGGSLAELVPQDGGGRVVAAESVDELASALAHLARDPAGRSDARAAGERLRAALEPDHVAGVFEELYRRVGFAKSRSM